MTRNHAKVLREHDSGICTSCDHFLTCCLRSEDKTPVFFCDEFACTSVGSRKRNRENFGLPGQHEGRFLVKKSEKARPAFMGLCRTCEKLVTCTFLKPGGGTWQCESYQEKATR